MLIKVLAFAVILIPVTYYLGETRKLSFFPSYLIAISIICLAWKATLRSIFLPATPTLNVLLALLSYMPLIVLWTSENLQMFGLYLGYGVLILSFVLSVPVCTLHHPGFPLMLLRLTVLAAAVSCTYSITLFYTLDFRPLSENRLHSLGSLHNPVIGAISYGVVAVLCTSLVIHEAGKMRKFIALLALGTLLWGVVLTGTRSVWLGYLSAAISIFFVLPNTTNKKKLLIATSGVLILIGLGIGLWFFDYHTAFFQRATSFRPEIWTEVILQTMLTAPILGHGIHTSSEFLIAGHLFDHPHSIYLATLFYGGIIGLMLLLMLFYTSVSTAWKHQGTNLRLFVIPCLTFSLITLLFDGNRIIEKVNFLWFAIWLPISLSITQALLVRCERIPKIDASSTLKTHPACK